MQLKEKFINNKEYKRIKELEKLNMELKQKITLIILISSGRVIRIHRLIFQ